MLLDLLVVDFDRSRNFGEASERLVQLEELHLAKQLRLKPATGSHHLKFLALSTTLKLRFS